jgi:hypothetical protein
MKNKPEGFDYQISKAGELTVTHFGRFATRMSAKQARSVISKLESASEEMRQQLLARLTGNYKRGNERLAKQS